MRLESSNGKPIKNPDERQIDETIRRLGDEGFVILAKDEMTYIQAAGSVADGFTLEYQAGDTDEHYAAKNGPHSVDDVSRAFGRYAAGDAQWKSAFEWEAISF